MAQDNQVKVPYLMPTPGNTAGATSGVSSTAGMGTSAGEHDIPPGTSDINIAASSENRSAKFKAPQVSQDQGAGADQYC